MARHREGSWHASRAARGLLQLLGWPKPLRFPRLAGLAHNLVNLIYSINHHVGFCHLLAIVVKDFNLRCSGQKDTILRTRQNCALLPASRRLSTPFQPPPTMVLKTRITELLGIKHPIIQGGMHYVG